MLKSDDDLTEQIYYEAIDLVRCRHPHLLTYITDQQKKVKDLFKTVKNDERSKSSSQYTHNYSNPIANYTLLQD